VDRTCYPIVDYLQCRCTHYPVGTFPGIGRRPRTRQNTRILSFLGGLGVVFSIYHIYVRSRCVSLSSSHLLFVAWRPLPEYASTVSFLTLKSPLCPSLHRHSQALLLGQLSLICLQTVPTFLVKARYPPEALSHVGYT